MYRAFGLLRPDSDFSLDQAQSRLAASFPELAMTREANQIVLSQGEWWLAVALVSGPDIHSHSAPFVAGLTRGVASP